MTEFLALFGIKPGQLKRNCILMPILPKRILSALKIKRLFSGKLYSCGVTQDFTLIRTGMGQALTGDAVLYLKDTPCRNIFLFGSCGLVAQQPGLSIGSLVAPFKSYAYESFSQILSGGNNRTKALTVDKNLLDAFLGGHENRGIKRVICATVSSLKLEQDLVARFTQQGISVVDMECSAFFSAARYAGLRAVAVFYIRDIICKKPFYANLSMAEIAKINASENYVLESLRKFIKKSAE